MDNTEIILTPEGKAKLVEELAYREGEKDAEIIERIKVARDFGDLSENSEYDDAKEEQSKNAARIAEIRKILATATISENAGGKRDPAVSIGCTVALEEVKTKKKVTFTLVGTTETDSLEHKISNESPVGAAIIGHKKGEMVTVSSPSGKTRDYVISKISR
ncbi:MAG: transcription elongation factor GreA [Atopobiaceae bacterium]|jgi:transcription elongation factor GreA|nr:transcription elongation factor GreA [Atopobiaceae bacterium]MCI2173898.1 transcription elongation factor GreA [Atopobiaceae bacterium]MCI2208012.1 transcription elongation factor GreA [Atopobiaceae bacterium]